MKKYRYSFKEANNDAIVNKLKIFFKKYPIVFNFFFYAFGASVVGESPKKAIRKINTDKLVINLGSGVRRVRDDVINIDFYPFSSVDILADICHLPFKDNSVDAVVNEFVLEHVKNPQIVIKEIYRVLKPGGLIYISVPFLISFHSSPDDYYRWTKNGFLELMKNFKKEKFGIRSGPTSSLISVINEWLAVVFSFNSKKLYQAWLMVLMIITCPFKIFDYVICKLPNAEDAALGFYFIGRK
ncbi:methyltransferase domain-containing protein [Patescibacteria group bacterium]